MAAILNTWAITSNDNDARTVELAAFPAEDGAGAFFVDQRDAWGRLVASEPFGTQHEARVFALKLVDADQRNSGILEIVA